MAQAGWAVTGREGRMGLLKEKLVPAASRSSAGAFCMEKDVLESLFYLFYPWNIPACGVRWINAVIPSLWR